MPRISAEATTRKPRARWPLTSKVSGLVGASLASLLVAVGSAAAAHVWAETRTGPSVVAQGSAKFPDGSVTDWAQLVDHLVEVVVSEDQELPASDSDAEIGEGLIMRRLTLDVAASHWSRSGALADPSSIEFVATGWAFDQNGRQPLDVAGSPRLEKGHRYLVAIVNVPPSRELGASGWMPLSTESIFTFDDRVISDGNDVAGHRPASWVYDFRGRSVTPIVQALRRQANSSAPRGDAFARLSSLK